MIEKPIDNLSVILKKLKEKLDFYKNDYKNTEANHTDNYNKKYKDDIFSFENEINKFEMGISLINKKQDVLNAFVLMNKTFAENKKGYKEWRLFQIVFIVSEICDIVYSEYHNGNPWYKNNSIDLVDMIYFSTGGGKTETFLGCVVFSMFFDRLRGKTSGTTAFIKYPLRLLTTQQLDRVLVLICQANEIMKENNIKGNLFDVGLLIGKEVSPNQITEEALNKFKGYDIDAFNSIFRKIDYCPICGKEVKVIFNEDLWEMQHQCPSCGVLPVKIIDDEIYRNPTSVIVSSIDKMACIGLFSGFKTIFGKNTGRCSKHGYVWNTNSKCRCSNCNGRILSSDKVKDPVPTLFIQDELHLLNESLGTYDSHYETFLQYYCEFLLNENDRKKIKYIGATATISDFEDHCFNLYMKNGKAFPSNVKNENFYSYVDENDLNRIIIGAALYGGSITDCIKNSIVLMRKIIRIYQKKVNTYYNDFVSLGFSGSKEDLVKCLDDYLISIVYNTSKMDSNNLQTTIQNQGNNELIDSGLECFNIGNITSDEDFNNIKDIMHEIENEKESVLNTYNLILATSAISHGVDEDRFNQIFFYGMPNKTSEYIQSYSRVGRKFTGIVFDVIRIAKNRDKSYLKNFVPYHKFKDLLVESVPIYRWAKMAIYSTLPGIVSAILLQHYNCDGYTKSAHDKILNHTIKYDDLLRIVKAAYGCDGNPDSLMYEEIIEEEIENIYNGLKNNIEQKQFLSAGIASCNTYGKEPMPSLRDVDVTLTAILEEA